MAAWRRATLGDWAEAAPLVGYCDSHYANECLARMNDLGWTQYSNENAIAGYNRLTTEDIVSTALKYGAKFVITVKPKTFNLPKRYENNIFLLYEFP